MNSWREKKHSWGRLPEEKEDFAEQGLNAALPEEAWAESSGGGGAQGAGAAWQGVLLALSKRG